MYIIRNQLYIFIEHITTYIKHILSITYILSANKENFTIKSKKYLFNYIPYIYYITIIITL
jgi:hypothetical protein